MAVIERIPLGSSEYPFSDAIINKIINEKGEEYYSKINHEHSNKADKLENGHGIVRSVNNQYADDNGNVNLSAFSVGDIKWSAADLTQAGFLVANGASVRRDTYPDLFKAIGTRWGSVDDEHFNLPDLIGKFAEGSETAGGYKEAGLPRIYGTFRSTSVNGDYGCTGAIEHKAGSQQGADAGLLNAGYYVFDSALSSPIYGNSDTVQPNSALLTPYIKAFAGASASSTDIEITKVAQDIADKADRDLSNLSENGRKAFFPSSTYKVLDDVPYIAGDYGKLIFIPPANGYIQAIGKISPNRGTSYIHYLFIQQAGRTQALEQEKVSPHGLGIIMPVLKGIPTYVRAFDMGASVTFYYAEGEV